MAVPAALLREILKIGHETSIRGAGISLRDVLTRSQYKDLRPSFGPEDLLPIIKSDRDIAEQWVAYSEDKRTNGGWYLLADGEVGRVGIPESRVQFGSIEEAAAEYVVRELDFWAGLGEAG